MIGTSLKVVPFAFIEGMIPKKTPILLLNKENVIKRKNVLHLDEDIDKNCQRILDDLK